MSLWLPTSSLVEGAPAGVEAAPEANGRAGREGAAPRRFLFVDRDGVVIEDAHYLHDADRVRLLPGAAAALRRTRAEGWGIVGLSNQSGIGRGLYGEAEFAAVQRRIDAELARAGARLDALFYCPHAPEAGCRCRKPAPGLLEEAAELFVWDRGSSWLVGDKASDVALAWAVGLAACLVLTGQGARQATLLPASAPVLIVDDLAAAVAHIVAGERA